MAHRTHVVYVEREQFAVLATLIPGDCSFSSPEHPKPNRVLWARHNEVDATQLVFVAEPLIRPSSASKPKGGT